MLATGFAAADLFAWEALFFAAAAATLCWPDLLVAAFPAAALPDAAFPASAPAESARPVPEWRESPDGEVGRSARPAGLPAAWLAELGPVEAASEIPTATLAATEALATVATATVSVRRDGRRRYLLACRGA